MLSPILFEFLRGINYHVIHILTLLNSIDQNCEHTKNFSFKRLHELSNVEYLICYLEIK
jgi:hypothetical protein